MQITVICSDEFVYNVLPLFVKAFDLYWPDCPWPVLAVCEVESAETLPYCLIGALDEGATFSDRLCRYLEMCGEDVILVMQAPMILYAQNVMTSDLELACGVLASTGFAGVLLYEHHGLEVPYNGLLRVLGGLSKDDVLNNAGLWKPPALLEIIKSNNWRDGDVLGFYHEPMVYTRLLIGGKEPETMMVSGIAIKGLENQGSPILKGIPALVAQYGIRELADLEVTDSPGVRESLRDIIARYGDFRAPQIEKE